MGRSKVIKQFIWNSFFWLEFIAALYIGYTVYFVDITSTKSKWIGLFAGVVAILFAVLKFVENAYISDKNDFSKEIIKSELSFLNIFYKKVAKLTSCLVFLSSIPAYYVYSAYDNIGTVSGLKFICLLIVGAISFLFVSVITSRLSLITSIDETLDFKNEISFKKIFNSSIVAAFLPFGILISLYVIFFHCFKDYQILFGFALGVSLVYFSLAIINIISLKTSDYTDEMFLAAENRNIEEKKIVTYLFDGFKSQTPVVFVASLIFMSYIIVFSVAVSTGAFCMAVMGQFLPIVIAANGLFSAILVLGLTKLSKETNYIKTFALVNIFTAIIFNIINYFTIKIWLPSYIGLVWALIAGSVAGIFVLFYNIKNIFYNEKNVEVTSNSATLGLKNEFIHTIKKSISSIYLPYLLMIVVILVSFFASYGLEVPLMGVWGVVLAAFGFLSCGIVSLLYAYFCQNLVNLDLFSKKFGNDIDFDLIKETGKKFLHIINKYTNFAFLLIMFALILGYGVTIELEEVDLMNPYVSSALLLGSGFVFICLTFLINNIFKNSKRLAFDIKKSLKFSAQNHDNLNLLNKFSLNNLLNDVQISFGAYFLLLTVLLLIVAILLKIEAIVGFLIGMTLTIAGVNFVLGNFSSIIYLIKRFLLRTLNNENDTLAQTNTKILQDCFSFFENFLSPVLILTIVFIAVVVMAFIPFWAKFV